MNRAIYLSKVREADSQGEDEAVRDMRIVREWNEKMGVELRIRNDCFEVFWSGIAERRNF